MYHCHWEFYANMYFCTSVKWLLLSFLSPVKMSQFEYFLKIYVLIICYARDTAVICKLHSVAVFHVNGFSCELYSSGVSLRFHFSTTFRWKSYLFGRFLSTSFLSFRFSFKLHFCLGSLSLSIALYWNKNDNKVFLWPFYNAVAGVIF